MLGLFYNVGKDVRCKKITGQHLHPYIKNVNVEWGNINIDNLDEMDFEDDEVDRYSVLPGDLMVCEGGEIGKCAIVPDEFLHGIYYQKALHRVRKRKGNNGSIKFLYYVILCMAKNDCFGTSPEKATIAHLPEDALKQLRIPTPCIEEQEKIVEFLDKKCGAINEVIEIKQKVVDKLISYKKSLIYEVVTGKRRLIKMINNIIGDINKSLDNENYFAALALALTLPDICGKAKYPTEGVGKRYIQWYDEHIGQYEKPTSKYGEDMPYLSGEVIYNLRNSFLHQGTPNIDKTLIKEIDCKIDEFELIFCKNLLGHTSMVSYNGSNLSRNEIVDRGYSVNVRLLCVRVCKAAETYYNQNKEKFNFFKYHIRYRDTE